MQSLKLKLQDQGLVGSLVLRESGAQIPLRFGRGEFSKAAKLNLGPTTMEVELRLEEIPGVGPELPNLTLTIVPAGQRAAAPIVTLVEAPAALPTTEPDATKSPTPPPAPGVDDGEELKAKAEAQAKADAEKAAEAEKAKADADAVAKAEAEASKTDDETKTTTTTTTTTPTPPASTGGKRNR